MTFSITPPSLTRQSTKSNQLTGKLHAQPQRVICLRHQKRFHMTSCSSVRLNSFPFIRQCSLRPTQVVYVRPSVPLSYVIFKHRFSLKYNDTAQWVTLKYLHLMYPAVLGFCIQPIRRSTTTRLLPSSVQMSVRFNGSGMTYETARIVGPWEGEGEKEGIRREGE